MNRDALFSVMRLGPVWTLRHSDSNAESLEQTPPLNREGECIVPSGEYEKIVWAEGVLNAQGQLQHDKPQTQLLMSILRALNWSLECSQSKIRVIGPEVFENEPCGVSLVQSCQIVLLFDQSILELDHEPKGSCSEFSQMIKKYQYSLEAQCVNLYSLDFLLANPQCKSEVWKKLISIFETTV